MVVMNHILGGGVSGRLFLNLREEKGYTYGVYSDFSARRYPGPWRAGGSMRTEVTAGALVEFFKEINHIRDQTVPPPNWKTNGHRGTLCTVAGTADRDSRACRFARAVSPTRRLLGYVPSQNHGSHRRGCATGGAQVSRPRCDAACRGG
jgi:hypothetical protein